MHSRARTIGTRECPATVGASFFAVEMHARQGNNEDRAWALLLACSLAQDTPQPPAFLFANADMFRRGDQVKLVRKSSPQHDDQAGIEVDEAGGVEDEDLEEVVLCTKPSKPPSERRKVG